MSLFANTVSSICCRNRSFQWFDFGLFIHDFVQVTVLKLLKTRYFGHRGFSQLIFPDLSTSGFQVLFNLFEFRVNSCLFHPRYVFYKLLFSFVIYFVSLRWQFALRLTWFQWFFHYLRLFYLVLHSFDRWIRRICSFTCLCLLCVHFYWNYVSRLAVLQNRVQTVISAENSGHRNVVVWVDFGVRALHGPWWLLPALGLRLDELIFWQILARFWPLLSFGLLWNPHWLERALFELGIFLCDSHRDHLRLSLFVPLHALLICKWIESFQLRIWIFPFELLARWSLKLRIVQKWQAPFVWITILVLYGLQLQLQLDLLNQFRLYLIDQIRLGFMTNFIDVLKSKSLNLLF